jgi:hypothetical protein
VLQKIGNGSVHISLVRPGVELFVFGNRFTMITMVVVGFGLRRCFGCVTPGGPEAWKRNHINHIRK